MGTKASAASSVPRKIWGQRQAYKRMSPEKYGDKGLVTTSAPRKIWGEGTDEVLKQTVKMRKAI